MLAGDTNSHTHYAATTYTKKTPSQMRRDNERKTIRAKRRRTESTDDHESPETTRNYHIVQEDYCKR